MNEEEKKSQEETTSQEIASGPEGDASQESTTSADANGQQATATQDATSQEIAAGPEGDANQESTTPVVNNGQQATATQVTTSQEIAAGPEGNTETTQSTGQGEVVTTPSTHQYDWSNKSMSTVISENPDKPLQDIISDHYKWARENGQTVDVIGISEAIRGKDASKSAAQNEADEKKRLRKEKFDQLGNFLLHLGNAIGNVAGGGMGAVKLEDPIKFTERQRQLKERAEEQRNRYNDSLLAQMSKQDAEARRAEIAKRNDERDQKKLDLEERKIGVAEAESKRKAYKDEFTIKMAQNKFDYQKEKDALDRKLKERQISATEHRLAIQAMNAATSDFIARTPVTTVEEVETPLGKNIKKRVQSRGNTGSKGNGYSTSGNTSATSAQGKGTGYN